jgi:hypothetical protein
VHIVKADSGLIRVMCENKEGITDWPIKVDGTILYDFPGRYPKYVKTLVHSAFDYIDNNPGEFTKTNPIVKIEVGSYIEESSNESRYVLRFWRKYSKRWNCAYACYAEDYGERMRLDRIVNSWITNGLIQIDSSMLCYDGMFVTYVPTQK